MPVMVVHVANIPLELVPIALLVLATVRPLNFQLALVRLVHIFPPFGKQPQKQKCCACFRRPLRGKCHALQRRCDEKRRLVASYLLGALHGLSLSNEVPTAKGPTCLLIEFYFNS